MHGGSNRIGAAIWEIILAFVFTDQKKRPMVRSKFGNYSIPLFGDLQYLLRNRGCPAERNLFSVEKFSIYSMYFSAAFVKSLVRSFKTGVCVSQCVKCST